MDYFDKRDADVGKVIYFIILQTQEEPLEEDSSVDDHGKSKNEALIDAV